MGRRVKKEIYVMGHRNPDTDSICSAIAYAHLKNAMLEGIRKKTHEVYDDFLIEGDEHLDYTYTARRAGQLNPETEYVLKYFDHKEPIYMSTTKTQVKDVSVRYVEGISRNLSLKEAWTIMKEVGVATLAVLDKDQRIEGIISLSDIAKSYMEVLDNTIIAAAKTPLKNIIRTIDGELITGDEERIVDDGKVALATANLDLINAFISKNDIVILGNRYEAQLCAIENEAGCLIVCDGVKVSRTIKKMAEDNNCAILTTPMDTYTVVRMINQSMPVSYFMKKDKLVTFETEDYIGDIQSVMLKKRYRDFPIVDKKGKFAGMISRRTLIDMNTKKMILVDHNEADQAAEGIDEAEVLEIIDHHKLGTIETIKPIKFRNQPVGCTSTIIHQMYQENDIEIPKDIAGIMCAAIISDTLLFRSPTCTREDLNAATILAEIAGIDMEKFAADMFHAGSNLESKPVEEIFYQDYKKFTAGDVIYGVGQIMAMSQDELEAIKKKIVPYIEKARETHKLQMVYFMLTNIMTESTELLFAGHNADNIASESFGVEAKNGSIILHGVVSRKKQLIPPLMATLQQ